MIGDLGAIQNETREILRRYLPPGPDIAVVDFPSHLNAGDSLIYLGQQRYLRQLGYRTRYLADWLDLDVDLLRRRVPDGPVLLQAGGNLGDRWAHTQQFREHVISQLHDRPIVQMPQSIDFKDPANRDRARRVFAAHPNLLILMRDHRGVETARQAFPDTRVEFCPDMALGVGELGSSSATKYDIVLLLRQDSERAAAHEELQFPSRMKVNAADWHLSGARLAAWRLMEQSRRVGRHPAARRPLHPLNRGTSEAMARLNVSSARAVIGAGQVVVTDRLHAAVLGALLGRQVVVLDNAYGKIAPIYENYLSMLGNITFATSPSEAIAAALGHFHALD